MALEQITTGPSGPTAVNTQCDPNGLTLDQQNVILAAVGTGGTERVVESLLATFGPALPLTAITTAQTVFSDALNKWLLNRVGRTLRLKGSMYYSTTSTNVATLTIAVTIGGVTVCTITTTASNTAASTNLQIDFEFLISVNTAGVNGIVVSHGILRANLGTATTAAMSAFDDTNTDPILNITVATNPAVGDTITINGTLVTFIVNGGTPVGNQVALGTTAAGTATALQTFLAASTDVNIVKSTWTNPSSGVVTGTAKAAGFVPSASTSVPAKLTLTNTSINLQQALTLAVTIAASAAVPSATLNFATLEVVA